MGIVSHLAKLDSDLDDIANFISDIDVILDRMICRDDSAYGDTHAIKDIVSNIRRVLKG